ncbi:MAG: glycosyltransferase family 9 protein, partial [Kiritimatiellae bacterium]|nr:glycosyltransferase family 9 protein [Kiritimatiellia bacterium]
EQHLIDRFIILGTKDEIDICQEVHSKLDNSINLAGKTNFEQLTSLLSITEITIANDSGGMHLATACGTKVIGIFGITDPYKTGPVGSKSAFLTNDDYPHSRDIPRISEVATECLKSITPDQVVEKANQLII